MKCSVAFWCFSPTAMFEHFQEIFYLVENQQKCTEQCTAAHSIFPSVWFMKLGWSGVQLQFFKSSLVSRMENGSKGEAKIEENALLGGRKSIRIYLLHFLVSAATNNLMINRKINITRAKLVAIVLGLWASKSTTWMIDFNDFMLNVPDDAKACIANVISWSRANKWTSE